MRTCPKCGFRDSLEWKNLHFQLYHEYMTLEDFRRLYPKLARELLKQQTEIGTKNIVYDDYNAYHLTKAGYVHRVPKELCPDGKWFHASSIYEKPKDPFQQRLLEASQ